MLKVAAIQMQMSIDKEANLVKAESLVREASSLGAKLVLLPELFEGLYFCKDMDRDTYSNSNVIQKSTEFVCIKVDGDKRPDVRDNYLVDSYPTTVFLNVNQVEIHRMKGYIGPGPFLEDMDYAIERAWV